MSLVFGYIYKITSPSGRIYIGKSINFKKRIQQYKSPNGMSSQPLLKRSLLKYGFDKHIVEIIEEPIEEFLNEREIYWIDFYKSNKGRYPKGNGMNCTDGGEGVLGRVASKETRLKISKSNTGKKASAETLRKLSDRMRGKKAWNKGLRGIYTEEVIKKMSESRKGRKLSDTQKAALSKANKGKKLSEDHKLIISKRMMGNKHGLGKVKSEETLRKISMSNKGKVVSLETREKISNTLKGNTLSKETVDKIVESRKHNLYKHNRPIIDLTTGIIFYNLTEASTAYNYSSSTLEKWLRGYTKNKSNLIYA